MFLRLAMNYVVSQCHPSKDPPASTSQVVLCRHVHHNWLSITISVESDKCIQ